MNKKSNKPSDEQKLDRVERGVLWFITIIFVFLSATTLFAEKIKDISSIVGVRENQLLGYGLVVGLAGTGDGTTSQFTVQSLANLLQSVNIKIDQAAIKSKNVAAVMVTSKLKPFTRQGDNLDVIVSSIGDAKSLEGGTLLLTPLKGVNGEIYAIGQGAITIGGMNSGGGGQKNHATVGKVIEGAMVEKSLTYDIYNKQQATLALNDSSFENAVNIQEKINQIYNTKVAVAIDPRSIKLTKPEKVSMVEFLADIGNIEISFFNQEKIVIDERTGTVIAGINIEVKPIMVTHGEISISIDSKLLEEGQKLTVASVTKALQKLGAKPKDVISILEAIKKAGALTAKLEVI